MSNFFVVVFADDGRVHLVKAHLRVLPRSAKAELMPKGCHPSDMAVNQFLSQRLIFNKGHGCGPKTATVVNNATPYFSGLPGAIIGAVVFKTQIKCHCNTHNTYGLPRNGKIKIYE